MLLLQSASSAQHVLGASARWRPEQRESLCQLDGNVLGGVHRKVDLAGAQGVLELGHPAGLVRRVSGRVGLRVPAGDDRDDLAVAVLGELQTFGDQIGLCKRERAAPRSDPHQRGARGGRAINGVGAGAP
jgi:hypothetical protein